VGKESVTCFTAVTPVESSQLSRVEQDTRSLIRL